MSQRWITAVLDTQTRGGLAVVQGKQGFAFDDNGVFFSREWVKGLGLPVACEHGIGHFEGEPVYLLVLEGADELPGCQWQSLRAFMLNDDFAHYRVLAYAAQISTWAREHRFLRQLRRT